MVESEIDSFVGKSGRDVTGKLEGYPLVESLV